MLNYQGSLPPKDCRNVSDKRQPVAIRLFLHMGGDRRPSGTRPFLWYPAAGPMADVDLWITWDIVRIWSLWLYQSCLDIVWFKYIDIYYSYNVIYIYYIYIHGNIYKYIYIYILGSPRHMPRRSVFEPGRSVGDFTDQSQKSSPRSPPGDPR